MVHKVNKYLTPMPLLTFLFPDKSPDWREAETPEGAVESLAGAAVVENLEAGVMG